MPRHEAHYELTDTEKRDLIKLIEQGRPLPDKYRFHKEPNLLEQIAYRDTWGRGADSLSAMIYERLILMCEWFKAGLAICNKIYSPSGIYG